jgi:hypothetical protein
MEANVYLGLRAIFWQLARAKSDDQLRAASGIMSAQAARALDASHRIRRRPARALT